MATVTLTTSVNNTTSGQLFSSSKTLGTTGADIDVRHTEIGTTEEEITISADVGDAAFVWIKNCDEDNYIQIGFATGVYNIRIPAGVSNLVSLDPATSSLFMKANTAACMVTMYFQEA